MGKDAALTAPELKPCPFCGGKPSHNEGGNSRYGRFWWRVGCVNCGVFFNDEEKWDANSPGNLDPECHQKQCFDTWNTRTDLIPSDPRVKALVEALQVTAGVLQSERTRSGGQQFTGVWSMPSIGRRVTVSEALDEADAALAALKGAT